PSPSPSLAQSPNWSGYVVPSTILVTETSGEWTVPTLNCLATPNGTVGIWVGIGGVEWSNGSSSGALLQTGVTATCVDGAQQDFGWWEEFPMNPNELIPFSGFPVSPGDLIKASVYEAVSGAWVTRVDDLSTGLSGIMITGEGWGVYVDGSGSSFPEQGSTADVFYSGGYTAEWIVEDPASQVKPTDVLVPFADYGTVTFSDLTTSLSPWYLTSSEAVEIYQNGTVLSTPSVPPGNDGFSVSYTG
ncbi:MAG: G1 family endopeptidase, partial [Actinobacteria bacterium]|nr:G1 family endopeptidase [Actinomycetota bacterium]